MAGIGSTGVEVSIKMGLTLTDMIGMKPIDSLTSVTQFNVVFVAQSTVGGMYAVNGFGKCCLEVSSSVTLSLCECHM